MNRLIRFVALATTCLALAVPQLEAQHTNTNRGRGGGNSRTTTTQQHRQSSSRAGNKSIPSRSNGAGNYRPGNNGNNKNNGNATRPSNGSTNRNPGNYRPGGTTSNGNNGNHGNPGTTPGQGGNNYRPGGTTNNGNHGNSGTTPGQGGNNYRPGGTTNNGNHGNPGIGNPGNRPGAGGGNNFRPGGNGNHGHHGNRNIRPGGARPPMVAPPVRPHRPMIHHAWRPPVPPPSWRPRPHAPALSAILGITFGTAIGVSIDMLLNSGYYVDGYGSNAVYLRDVREANYVWPDATFYYGPNGGFSRSEFLYSTPYPDMMRYNSLYNSFVATYGAPLNVVNGAATWFAPNRGYITLQYNQQQSLGGQMRFFTTLTLGM